MEAAGAERQEGMGHAVMCVGTGGARGGWVSRGQPPTLCMNAWCCLFATWPMRVCVSCTSSWAMSFSWPSTP